MTQANCGTCQYWAKEGLAHSNWGTCTKIKVGYGGSDQACLHERSPLTNNTNPTKLVLYTRDVFYCAEFSYKRQPEYTIVDAAREAAKRLNKRTSTDRPTGE